MKLTRDQADVAEEYLSSPGWLWVLDFIEERLKSYQRSLKSGRLDHDDYLRTCAAIRELEYLRDEPQRLVRKSYAELKDGY